MPKTHRAGVVCLVALLALPSRGGVAQPDLAAVRGDQSRALLGEGQGVIVGIVDGGVDPNHPALAGSMIAAKDFSGVGNTLDDTTGGIGHGTGVMSLMIGHDPVNGYLGLAPAAKFVNARVVDNSGNATDAQMGDGALWAVGKGAKVVNISLGNSNAAPDKNRLNMMLDYATEKYGAVFVVAAGNENVSAVQYSPGGQYNSMTVGATGGPNFSVITNFSNFADTTDGRTKPDLVAPGQNTSMAAANWATNDPYIEDATGTSFSAPIVGGVVAQMMGYGKAHHLSVSPLVMKAVVMTSTMKITDYEGTPWALRHQTSTATGTTIDQGLDAEQGAGQVDGVGAYDVYARKTTRDEVYSNWAQSGLRQDGAFTMKLGKLKAGEHLDGTLTWLRHITRSGGGSSARYSQAATLANFSLTLLLDGKKVITSDSAWDNLDYLSFDIPENGNYSLLVSRLPGSGTSLEDFGLAARVLSDASVGSVEPSDVASLLTKASVGVLYGPSIQKSYTGPTSFTSPVSVPEPAGVVWVTVMAVALRRRRRDYLAGSLANRV